MSGKFLLANMMSAIKNSKPLSSKPLLVEYSKLMLGVLSVLQKDGYVESFEVINKTESIPLIKINLALRNGKKLISEVKIVSKPGCRSYRSVEDIKYLVSRNKYKTYILSTPKGVMNAADALDITSGGELLCEVF
jgi:small subunit ribosomal protein S8